MVYHQNVLSTRGRLPEEFCVAVGWFCYELRSPCFRERRAVNILVLLGPCCYVGSTSCSLVMNNLTQWLI